MKTYIKKFLNNKELLIYSVITIVFFGIFLNIEYAVDSYATFSFNIQELYDQFAPCGRFMIVLVGTVLKFFNFNDKIVYLLSFLFGITCMIIAQYKLYYLIKEDVKDRKIRLVIPTLILLNVFSIELFLFIEKGLMMFSILMCICALESIIKLFDTKNKKYFLYALIYVLLSNFSYQGVTGIFVAISLIYILKYSKTIKEFLLNNLIVAFAYGIPSVIDYILIRIFSVGSRVSGQIVLIESIKKIIKSTWEMLNYMYKLLPKYFYLALVVIIFGLLIFKILTQKEKKGVEILKIVYIFGGTILVTIFPQIMQSTEWIWLVPRSAYSFAAIYGILILYLTMNYSIGKSLKTLILVLSSMLLIFQFYSFNKISTDRYKVNAVDYEITKRICQDIKQYEEKTGEIIKKIAIYNDAEIEYSYKGILVTGDINLKAYSKEWGILSIIEYYDGRKLNQIEQDKKYQEKFSKENWTSFSSEQLFFDGDTLHLCMY